MPKRKFLLSEDEMWIGGVASPRSPAAAVQKKKWDSSLLLRVIALGIIVVCAIMATATIPVTILAKCTSVVLVIVALTGAMATYVTLVFSTLSFIRKLR
jgi:hypothetical protein